MHWPQKSTKIAKKLRDINSHLCVPCVLSRQNILSILLILSKSGFWLFAALVFFGSLVWAHSRDPFRRTEFSVKSAAGGKVTLPSESVRGR